ncbi:MAG: nucleotidyl transferase AbiEii/AbiGii toxin family protein [Patescibacteria group bacterium]
MGKMPDFTEEQQIILDEVNQNSFLKKEFYFTGGTVLSHLYYGHRYSEDLDFFSQKRFDPVVLTTLLTEWSRKHRFTFVSEFIEVVLRVKLYFGNQLLKVDFGYYPYSQLEATTNYKDIRVDSLLDIAVNKIQTVTRRTEVKDFVDLYYLLQKFSLWDLREGVRIKFGMDFDPLILGSDLLQVDAFEQLPRMIKPLSLKELKTYFRQQAEILGRTVTK